jgi:hypothetical protein
LETYLSAFRDRELVISPIATRGLPQRLERVRLVVLGGHDFELHGGPAFVARNVICIATDDVRLVPIPEGRTSARHVPRDPHVLVVPHGGDELALYAMPVVDVSRDGCAVDSADGMPVGERIPEVELWGDRRLLRRATAEVLDSIPWRTPAGDCRFRLRLKLLPVDGVASKHADELSDPARIRAVMEVAALLGTSSTLLIPGGERVQGKLLEAKNAELKLSVDGGELDVPRVELHLELFGVSYAMTTRVLRGPHEGAVSLAYPLVVRRRQRRYRFRAEVPADVSVLLSAYNPVTGATVERRLRDLSFGGLSFALDPGEDVLWPGLTLERASLSSPRGNLSLGEVEIRSVQDGEVCRAALRESSAVDSPKFVDLMAGLRYPHMGVGTGDDFDAMIRLYEEVGLFGEHMTRNLPPVRDEARLTWQKLHRTDLCRTLVQREDGHPVAAVSAVRAWEQAWVIQHMVAAPTRRHREPGLLHMAYLDYVLPRPDGRYMVVFVNTANHRITAFLKRFFELTGTPEAISQRDVDLWVLRAGQTIQSPLPSSDLRIRPMRVSDEIVVQRAAERLFGRLGAAALSLREGELQIPETEQTFARDEVRRTRRIDIVTHRGLPLLALVEEQADPGFNLTWLVNATWVLPIHDAGLGRDALTAAAHHIATDAEAVGIGDRFLMIPSEMGASTLSECGFDHEAGVAINTYNRAGLHRWYYFVRERYGEMRAQKIADVIAKRP